MKTKFVKCWRSLLRSVLCSSSFRSTYFPFNIVPIYLKKSFDLPKIFLPLQCRLYSLLWYKPLNCQHKLFLKVVYNFFAEDKNECRQDQLKSANDLDDICLADKVSKPKKRRVTNEDVLQMQCDCLSLQRENLL